jgi:hypothetical protein
VTRRRYLLIATAATSRPRPRADVAARKPAWLGRFRRLLPRLRRPPISQQAKTLCEGVRERDRGWGRVRRRRGALSTLTVGSPDAQTRGRRGTGSPRPSQTGKGMARPGCSSSRHSLRERLECRARLCTTPRELRLDDDRRRAHRALRVNVEFDPAYCNVIQTRCRDHQAAAAAQENGPVSHPRACPLRPLGP